MLHGEGQASLPLVIAVVGPTASGKTDIGIELALQLNGEVISCDSRTIYKQMDIGTAKPTASQQAQVKHHLIDVIDPDRFYSIAEYQKTAKVIANDISSNHKVPIVVGGTGLYARALLQGIQPPEIPAQEELRKSLNKLADEQGNSLLHAKLKELDPITAERLNMNDKLRVIRALEVCMVSGRPFSQMASRVEPSFETIWIGLCWQDKTCHSQVITDRLKRQFELGLVEEVQNLLLEPSYHPVMKRAINYKEFIPYLENKESLDLVRENCILHNLQLARKQMMWFKTNQDIAWFAVDKLGLKAAFVQILAHCTRRLKRNSYTG
jgi:tRNA dimethylallyltransferase